MNNYFIFYVFGAEAKHYLGGTNYVGIWSTDFISAIKTVKKYFKEGTIIQLVEKEDTQGKKIGYLY